VLVLPLDHIRDLGRVCPLPCAEAIGRDDAAPAAKRRWSACSSTTLTIWIGASFRQVQRPLGEPDAEPLPEGRVWRIFPRVEQRAKLLETAPVEEGRHVDEAPRRPCSLRSGLRFRASGRDPERLGSRLRRWRPVAPAAAPGLNRRQCPTTPAASRSPCPWRSPLASR
jgi:hypothetical protein